jgi:hypothetical protein
MVSARLMSSCSFIERLTLGGGRGSPQRRGVEACRRRGPGSVAPNERVCAFCCGLFRPDRWIAG